MKLVAKQFFQSGRHIVIVRAKLVCRDFIKEISQNLLSTFHLLCCQSITGKSAVNRPFGSGEEEQNIFSK